MVAYGYVPIAARSPTVAKLSMLMLMLRLTKLTLVVFAPSTLIIPGSYTGIIPLIIAASDVLSRDVYMLHSVLVP